MEPITENIIDNTTNHHKIQISENERKNNLARVQFTRPNAKDIISHHTGCEVLTTPSQNNDLSSYLPKISSYLFLHASSSPESQDEKYIKSSQIIDFLKFMGFDMNITSSTYQESIKIVTERIFKELHINICDDHINIYEAQLIEMMRIFPLLSHYNGHKLRKYCARGMIDDVIELALRGCDVNACDGDGLSALQYACELDRVDIIILLHELGGEKLSINARDKYGWTAAHTSCHHGCISSLKMLISYGVDVSIGDVYGKTCLHIAAMRGYDNIAKMLIDEHHMSASCVCMKNLTPAHDAALKQQLIVYDTLINHSSYNPSIRDALSYTASDYCKDEMYRRDYIQ